MTRVVLDTNTIISALIWGGPPWAVYEAALGEQYVLLTTNMLLEELDNVLHRPKFAPALKTANKTSDEFLHHIAKLQNL